MLEHLCAYDHIVRAVCDGDLRKIAYIGKISSTVIVPDSLEVCGLVEHMAEQLSIRRVPATSIQNPETGSARMRGSVSHPMGKMVPGRVRGRKQPSECHHMPIVPQTGPPFAP